MGMMRRAAGALASALLMAAAPASFTNPVMHDGADPWVARDGKTYYLMVTRGDRLTIRKTTDITAVAVAPEVTVWTPPRSGPNSQGIEAAELHRLGGRWFIYYAASDNPSDNRRFGLFVLENDGPDPTKGRWIDRGRIDTNYPGIDPTVFSYRGKTYLAYSLQLGAASRLAIAQLRNPWTLATRESLISHPYYPWERVTYPINEGPEFLEGPKGELFLTFSASACTSDEYAIGLLSAPAGSNPLDPNVWSKAPAPVIAKDPGPGVGVFGPGHNGFFTSPDGKQHWIIFHANSGPSQGCSGGRNLWIEPFTFGANGRPVFRSPTGPAVRLAAPSGQAAR